MGDERIELIFDEARQALDRQADTLEEFRNRASAILGAASIAAGFLGAEALAQEHLTVWTGLASLSFILVGLCTVFVLLPRSPRLAGDTGLGPGWRFQFSPTKLFQQHIDASPERSIDEMRSDLALHMESNWDHNATGLRRLSLALEVACASLVVEIVAFFAELVRRG